MELFDERNQVRTVAKRWFRVYGRGTYGADKRGRMVGDELSELDVETATAEQVLEITGITGWVGKQKCDECGAESWSIVQLGEEPDYESNTSNICADCLRAALRLLGNA